MLLFIEERWIMQLFIWCHTQQKIALLFWAELRRAKLRKALTFASRELWYALVRVFTKFPWGRVLAYHIFTTFLVWTRLFVLLIINGLQNCYWKYLTTPMLFQIWIYHLFWWVWVKSVENLHPVKVQIVSSILGMGFVLGLFPFWNGASF